MSLDGKIALVTGATRGIGKAIAEALGKPLPEVALRYALFEAGADVTLVGTANPAELDSNVNAALDGPLPSDVVAALRAINVADERLLDPSNWPVT